MVRKKGNIFSRYWGVVIVGVVLVAFLAWRQGGTSDTLNSNFQTKMFKSNNVMDFEVEVPNKFTVAEQSSRVSFSSQEQGIYIDQVFTEFDDLKDYILNSKNNLKTRLIDREEISINGLEAVSGFIGDRKEYLIYADGRVYFIFTDSPALYDDLDQIAQSFRYTPE